MRTLSTNFDDKLLVHFCTLLAACLVLLYFHTFSEPVDLNINQIVIVYRRTIVVRCSENFPDQLHWQAINTLLYFVGLWIKCYFTFVLFLSQWIETEIE